MPRKLVILNQAANYLTVGFANAFNRQFDAVALVTGSIHIQGEELDPGIEVTWINRWYERPTWKKAVSFAFSLFRMWVLLLTKYRKYDVLFVSVPPMAYLLNLVSPNRFSMVIWDVYPDIFRITGMRESHWFYRVWAKLNRWSFSRAYRLYTISDILADAIGQYADRSRVIVNPIWSMFEDETRIPKSENPFVREHDLDNKFVVQYSGNIGVSHNVEVLIDVAALLEADSKIVFQIIGRGPRRDAIEKLVRERNLRNVQMLPFQSDEMFPYSLSAADLGVVILHDLVSKGSVPSKAFNLMAYGIPGLYVASSESELANYARKYKHAEVFQSENVVDIAEYVQSLASDLVRQSEMQANARRAAGDFSRSNADRFVAGYLASVERVR